MTAFRLLCAIGAVSLSFTAASAQSNTGNKPVVVERYEKKETKGKLSENYTSPNGVKIWSETKVVPAGLGTWFKEKIGLIERPDPAMFHQSIAPPDAKADIANAIPASRVKFGRPVTMTVRNSSTAPVVPALPPNAPELQSAPSLAPKAAPTTPTAPIPPSIPQQMPSGVPQQMPSGLPTATGEPPLVPVTPASNSRF